MTIDLTNAKLATVQGLVELYQYGRTNVMLTTPVKPHRKTGSAKGAVIMSNDFDAPLADLEEYMP